MTNLYHSAVYDRTRPVGSFWETTVPSVQAHDFPALQGDRTTEVAIIGGGLTGLSAALHLAKDHHIQAEVLEAGNPAWGASGRNGGFACVGSTWRSHPDLLQHFGEAETRRFFQHQRDGVDLVRHLAATEALAIDPQGNGEIQVAHQPSRWKDLETEAEFFTQVANYPCQLWTVNDLAEHAYTSPQAHGALHVGVGFGLNPMKYTRGLAAVAQRRGVSIHAGSPVTQWEKLGEWHHLRTPSGTLRAKRVIVATNGYTQETLHPAFRGVLLPTLSAILTTRPLTSAERKAQGWHTETPVFDTRNLLFYFRLLTDGRFLFGSRGGTVGSAQESDRRRAEMIRSFQQMFPAWRDVEMTHFWSGLVCGSATLTPHLGSLPDDPSVFHAIAFHGNGVAAGSWSGRAIAQLLANKLQPSDISTIYRQPLKRFLLPGLRVWYLRSAYWAYGLQDRGLEARGGSRESREKGERRTSD